MRDDAYVTELLNTKDFTSLTPPPPPPAQRFDEIAVTDTSLANIVTNYTCVFSDQMYGLHMNIE